MVWHAFMLNPVNYLEDCLRFCLKDTFATGMPWHTVDAAIDSQFNYTAPESARLNFIADTHRAWNVVDEPEVKHLKCPRCKKNLAIPWTTCALPEKLVGNARPGLVGNGYGEKDFSYFCEECGGEIDHDMLRVAKFKKDSESLILNDFPMPGTLIFGTTGVPEIIRPEEKADFHGTFPNRLITKELKSKIIELCQPYGPKATMTDVREMIEGTITSTSAVRNINSKPAVGRGGKLNRQERLSVRKMMSRYWVSHTIFGMELGGAVIRQGEFVNKMRGLDWLHSPAARNTMSRLLTKYARFMKIIAQNPSQVAVPTLDVDLAWHTHQLSPSAYFNYSLRITTPIRARYIDHDDKIDQDKLSDSFEWTSKIYERNFGEVYSECSCWYCEAIRAKHVSTVSSLLGSSKHEKITDSFHASGTANMCPPDKSAHISAHNAMPVEYSELHSRTREHMTRTREKQLDDAYERACKRAIKKGRKPPEKERFVNERWGYGYYGYYPYTGAYLWMTPGLYYYPMMMPMGVGMYGACAAGTCGGGVAAGACGGAGGCGGGCGGGSGGCGAGGASGGCGGGGGGGCGGGGGGG